MAFRIGAVTVKMDTTSSFEKTLAAAVGLLMVVSLIFVTVRKIAYQLYLWFPTANRVCEFLWKREFKFYWANRADFTTLELVRLYALWIMARLDKYLPIIDCERQAAKAQYFHDSGRYSGMGSWHFRRINPKAWPVLFVRNFASFLFPSLSNPCDAKIDNPQNQTASNEAHDK